MIENMEVDEIMTDTRLAVPAIFDKNPNSKE